MKLDETTKKEIENNYKSWFDHQYADKTLKERQLLGQFFTPSDITIEMIEKYSFDSFDNRTILDPCCGSGNLLVGCILAGAKPENVYGNDYDPVMVKLCQDRLEEFGVPRENIHQGNALHSFCLKYFGDNYDSLYFSDKDHFNVMNNEMSDELAWNRIKDVDPKAYDEYQKVKKEQRSKQNEIEIAAEQQKRQFEIESKKAANKEVVEQAELW